MLQDLDATISTLLSQQLPPDLMQQITISFLTPDSQFPPSAALLPAVNLFLYDIQENLELRDLEPAYERQLSGRVMSARGPLRVDCSYLVTAWAKSGALTPDQDEHRMLGAVMKVLFLHRELPAAVLQGDLQGTPIPIRAQVVPMGQLQSRGEFWQALGGRPRVTINYKVTLAVEIEEPLDVGAAAIDVRL